MNHDENWQGRNFKLKTMFAPGANSPILGARRFERVKLCQSKG